MPDGSVRPLPESAKEQCSTSRRKQPDSRPSALFAVSNGPPSVRPRPSARDGPGQDLGVLRWSELQPVPVPSRRRARPTPDTPARPNLGPHDTFLTPSSWHLPLLQPVPVQ
eukprot:scaffold47669_cov58-Phaeocystis_antarctica.AAC.3